MKISDFRHWITFQQYVSTEDELGQEIGNWVDVRSFWAMIKTIQGREYFVAGVDQRNENTIRFITRYVSGIDSTMRIVYKDRILEIKSVINDDERNKTLTIIASEKGVVS